MSKLARAYLPIIQRVYDEHGRSKAIELIAYKLHLTEKQAKCALDSLLREKLIHGLEPQETARIALPTSEDMTKNTNLGI